MKNLEGKSAPDFTLEGNDGKRHSLKDYKGKTVVLYFYPKDNTPGCTKEACGFRDLGAPLKKGGAVVLGVSKDSLDSHNKFAGNYMLQFTLLSDPKAEVMKKYGAFGKKMMYGKEVQGTNSLHSRNWSQGRGYQALAHGQEGRRSPQRSARLFAKPLRRSKPALWLSQPAAI